MKSNRYLKNTSQTTNRAIIFLITQNNLLMISFTYDLEQHLSVLVFATSELYSISLKRDSDPVQFLLTVCQKFVMVKTFGNALG